MTTCGLGSRKRERSRFWWEIELSTSTGVVDEIADWRQAGRGYESWCYGMGWFAIVNDIMRRVDRLAFTESDIGLPCGLITLQTREPALKR